MVEKLKGSVLAVILFSAFALGADSKPFNHSTFQPFNSLYVRHLGIYAYRGAFLKKYIAEPPCQLEKTEKLEQLRALWMGAKIAVVRTEDEGVGVDTPEDAVRVGKILESRTAK